MLEFLHKYVAEVVSDAAVYQEHAGKPEVDIDDLRLAIQVSCLDYAERSAQNMLTRAQDRCCLKIDNVNAILCYLKPSMKFEAREHVRANTQTGMVLRSFNIESQSDLCVDLLLRALPCSRRK